MWTTYLTTKYADFILGSNQHNGQTDFWVQLEICEHTSATVIEGGGNEKVIRYRVTTLVTAVKRKVFARITVFCSSPAVCSSEKLRELATAQQTR